MDLHDYVDQTHGFRAIPRFCHDLFTIASQKRLSQIIFMHIYYLHGECYLRKPRPFTDKILKFFTRFPCNSSLMDPSRSFPCEWYPTIHLALKGRGPVRSTSDSTCISCEVYGQRSLSCSLAIPVRCINQRIQTGRARGSDVFIHALHGPITERMYRLCFLCRCAALWSR